MIQKHTIQQSSKTILGKALMLTILCIMTSLALSAIVFAEETVYTEGVLDYVIEENAASIIGCYGRDSAVDVPAVIDGYPVIAIKGGAFTSNEDVSVVNVPKSITTIEDGAFSENMTVNYVGSELDGVTATDETAYDKNDGTLLGVNDTMEYCLADTLKWESVPTGVTGIEGLSAGRYYVRLKATDTQKASDAQEFVIKQGKKNPASVKTGDSNRMLIWLMLTLAAMIAVFTGGTVALRRK